MIRVVIAGLLLLGDRFAHADSTALADSCSKGSADACASLGTITYQKDKEKGSEYFRRACDLGKESTCVFYDSAHPRSAAAAVSAQKPVPDAPSATDEAKLLAWTNANVPDLLLALYPVRSVGLAGHFSLDQCRIPDAKLVQLVMKVIKVYPHKFAFKKGCDAEGTMDVQLDTPYDLNLKVRDFGGVERLEGRVTTTVKLNPTTSEVNQTTTITNGVAYDGKGGVFARFELGHDRTVAIQFAKARVTTIENVGRVSVSEFQGKPVHHEQKFALDHVDR